ncbi:MAG: chorismate synthase, partial [Vicinamibacterales bacterium]
MTILEGLPAGLTIDTDAMTVELRRRQGGYGRGRRMAIESDRAEVLSGVRRGRTTGAPVALLVRNKDWENWQNTMHVEPQAPAGATGANRAAVVRPRPGHADLAGALKYDHDDIRDVLERASARETAARVAAGAIARQLLAAIGCDLTSHITGIGPVVRPAGAPVSFEACLAMDLEAPLRCTDPAIEQQMMAAIDSAKAAGDTLGGSFEVIARNVPVGLGSYVQWDRKLDGRLAQALMSIPAIKAVAVGDGVEGSRRPGSQVHDEIVVDQAAAAAGGPVIARPTNHAGGLEGGVTNGEE